MAKKPRKNPKKASLPAAREKRRLPAKGSESALVGEIANEMGISRQELLMKRMPLVSIEKPPPPSPGVSLRRIKNKVGDLAEENRLLRVALALRDMTDKVCCAEMGGLIVDGYAMVDDSGVHLHVGKAGNGRSVAPKFCLFCAAPKALKKEEPAP